MTDERRNHQRVDVQLEGEIRQEPDPAFIDMMMANLSLGGCFIRTRMPEPPGAMVMLRFALPGEHTGTVIKAVGRVCWVRGDVDGVAGMGIQFVRVDDEDLTELKRYIGGLLDGDLFEVEAA